MISFPEPARRRLLHILRTLETLLRETPEEAVRSVTSLELEDLSGWPRHIIRKDLSLLGAAGPELGSRAGYNPRRLLPRIKEALDLDRRRKFCVVGLGRLGSAYLNLDPASLGEFELAAGFDNNVNRVEILKSPAPLFPVFKMREVVGRFGIELALLCVPAGEAQGAAEKCAAAGIRGILNFAPVVLKPPERRPRAADAAGPAVETMKPALGPVTVRNVYITDELRALTLQL
ncbi:MAG: CoA-binding protein [Treponema sp.]|nr:CoA-binding protein [Treponema sp.]